MYYAHECIFHGFPTNVQHCLDQSIVCKNVLGMFCKLCSIKFTYLVILMYYNTRKQLYTHKHRHTNTRTNALLAYHHNIVV